MKLSAQAATTQTVLALCRVPLHDLLVCYLGYRALATERVRGTAHLFR